MRIDPRLPLLVAGLAGLIVGNLPWWTAAWTSEFAGSEVSIGAQPGTGGLSGALPGVVLVAVLLTLTLAVRGRRIVGVLTALVGLAMIAVGLTVSSPSDAVVTQAAPAAGLAGASSVTATAGPLGYALCGLLVAAASGWLVARPPVPRPRGNTGARQEVASALDSWKAMDEGLDPTDDERDGA